MGHWRKRIGILVRLSPREHAELAWAVVELARARRRLIHLQVVDLLASAELVGDPPDEQALALSERVGRAVVRAAQAVPWRSDCLVQALAAQHWLAQRGISTELRLGARKGTSERPDAHAWLLCGDKVVTGGDVASFRPFTLSRNE